MASIVRKLEKKGVIAMTLLTLVLIGTSCEDRIDNPAVHPSEGEMVEVALNIGFADEVDGATLSANTKAPNNSDGNKQTAFDMQLVPASQTRAATVAHPDKFYHLEIYQYDNTTEGNNIVAVTNMTNPKDPGTLIANLTNSDDCQLLIIARGATGAVPSLGANSLSNVQKIMANAETIKAIGVTNGTNINNMPYLLYLPKVKIVDGKLVSPEGTDVRLLLKRLAVGVTIDWKFSETMKNNYTLSEVRLMQVPKDYRILPKTEDDPTFGVVYPTSVSEFVDGFRLKGKDLTDAGGTQTFWMPANARGIRNDVTYPTYRNKNYAHSAATYVEFVVNSTTNDERLLYRAYLGGNTTNDFNLLENTNYHWTININDDNYTNDPRIQLLDLSPVISSNLQSTSNCFMMLPGTNICFNPYKHEAGTNGWNTELTTSGTAIKEGKTIDRVEVLWQSKDAGTSGDLVMGYIADDTNHKNLVNLTEGNDINNARIHVKVPVTSGGNAVIAAYNSFNKIVWSWHIWISDYVPVGLTGDITEENRAAAIETAQKATKEGMVQVYGGISWTASDGAFFNKVIMDRNLGAIRAGIQDNLLDAARTFGLLYQGGRKDPFFSSADGTKNETKTIYNGNGEEATLEKVTPQDIADYDQTIANPLTFYISNGGAPFSKQPDAWGGTGNKTIYDPCPKGWRVPINGSTNATPNAKKSLMAGFGSSNPSWLSPGKAPEDNTQLQYYNGKNFVDIMIGSTVSSSDIVGSGFIYTGGSEDPMEINKISNKSAFFPGVSLREYNSGEYRERNDIKNNTVYIWSSSAASSSYLRIYQFQQGLLSLHGEIPRTFGFSVRCVQDK